MPGPSCLICLFRFIISDCSLGIGVVCCTMVSIIRLSTEENNFRHEQDFFDAILSERFLTSGNEVFPLVSVSNRCSDLGLRMMSEGQARKGRSYHPLPSHHSQDHSRLCSVFCSEQRGLCRGQGPPNRICMRRPKGSQLWRGRSLLRSLSRSTCRTFHAQCSRPIEERKTGMRARRSKD